MYRIYGKACNPTCLHHGYALAICYVFCNVFDSGFWQTLENKYLVSFFFEIYFCLMNFCFINEKDQKWLEVFFFKLSRCRTIINDNNIDPQMCFMIDYNLETRKRMMETSMVKWGGGGGWSVVTGRGPLVQLIN